MIATARVAADHGLFNRIRQVALIPHQIMNPWTNASLPSEQHLDRFSGQPFLHSSIRATNTETHCRPRYRIVRI